MRKYNIPLKEIKEVKQEIVECSSGGEGVKEYYYKTDESIKEEVLMILVELFSSCNTNILLKKLSGEVVFETNLSICFSNIEHAISQYAGYIKLDGRPSTVVILNDYDNFVPDGIFEGNITDRFNKIGVPEYANYFQEITKEEYESMITYKPE